MEKIITKTKAINELCKMGFILLGSNNKIGESQLRLGEITNPASLGYPQFEIKINGHFEMIVNGEITTESDWNTFKSKVQDAKNNWILRSKKKQNQKKEEIQWVEHKGDMIPVNTYKTLLNEKMESIKAGKISAKKGLLTTPDGKPFKSEN